MAHLGVCRGADARCLCRAGASLKETITKDHVKSGRSNIYNELRAWPTTVYGAVHRCCRLSMRLSLP